MSSTIPSVDDRPAKQCPPPRGAMRSPVAVAYVMAPNDVRDRAARNHEPGTHLPVGEVDRAADRFVARRVRAEQLAVE